MLLKEISSEQHSRFNMQCAKAGATVVLSGIFLFEASKLFQHPKTSASIVTLTIKRLRFNTVYPG